MNQFLDLLQTSSVVLPLLSALLILFAILGTVIYFWPDESDRELERAEAARSENMQSRLSHFANTGELLPAKERMDTLTKPAEGLSITWITELLTKYQFAMEFDAESSRVRLVDMKFEALRNKELGIDRSRVVGANYREFKTLMIHARSTINRRAQRAGLLPVKHRKAEEVSAA